MALRTARAEPARVFLPALVIFGLDAINSTFFTEVEIHHLGRLSLLAALSLVASTFGLTFYAGLMERMVGAVERGEAAPDVSVVLRTLPYARLLIADAILWVLSSVASLAFVIPGIIVTTLFALIGPLINMENIAVVPAFRRSATLVAPKFLLVLCLITIPLGLEHEIVSALAYAEPHDRIWLVFLTYFLAGITFGVMLGLMEVSLAERLVRGAHGPGYSQPAPLRSGGQPEQ